MKTYPIRWCTGGCQNGPHSPHLYEIDPVDGPMRKPHLCPGNTTDPIVIEIYEGEDATLFGFIADPTALSRYHALIAASRNATILSDEREELMRLHDQFYH